MLTDLSKKFKNFFLKKDYFFWDFLFFILLFFFFLRYWKKQLSISYIDYGDGCLLYQVSLFKNGLIIYKDFFAPQPPIIYLFWRLILKIFNNPISIRYFLVVLFLSDFT